MRVNCLKQARKGMHCHLHCLKWQQGLQTFEFGDRSINDSCKEVEKLLERRPTLFAGHFAGFSTFLDYRSPKYSAGGVEVDEQFRKFPSEGT